MQCQPLVQKILQKMNSWATKLLSYAGRVQLIKSVIFDVQMYWCQVILLPQKILKMIQSTCRTFLWTGKTTLSKRALVAWDRIILPKHAGGLNIGNIKLWNQAAICKLLWSIQQKKDRTWIRWVHGYYIKDRDLFEMPIPQQGSWVVRKILGAREYLRKLHNGDEVIQAPTFSIRKMYKELMGCIVKVPWAKMLCQNLTPPKCLFITWLLLHEKLATCNYLQQVGVHTDPICCLCARSDESLDHLFFKCEYVSRVWRGVTAWCGVARQAVRWELEKSFLISECTNNNAKQKLYRCLVAIVSYHVGGKGTQEE